MNSFYFSDILRTLGIIIIIINYSPYLFNKNIRVLPITQERSWKYYFGNNSIESRKV